MFCLFLSPVSRRLSLGLVLNSLTSAQRCVSPVQRSAPGFSSAVSVRKEVLVLGLMRVGSGSDAGELVPEAGRQDALHLLHDEVERSEQRAEELRGRRRRTLSPLSTQEDEEQTTQQN